MSWEEAEKNVPQVDRDGFAKKFVDGFDSYIARLNASKVAVAKAEGNAQARSAAGIIRKYCLNVMRQNTAKQVTDNIFSNDAVKIIKNADVLKIIGDYAEETYYSLSDNQFSQASHAVEYLLSCPANYSNHATLASHNLRGEAATQYLSSCAPFYTKIPIIAIENDIQDNGIRNLIIITKDHHERAFLIKPEYASIADTCIWKGKMNYIFGLETATLCPYKDDTGYIVDFPRRHDDNVRFRYLQIDNPSSSMPTLRRLGFLK